jgi:hypothetical protein
VASRIIAKYDPPPIPDRRFDWYAVTDEYDGPGSPIGHGRTEEEAVADLRQQLDDEEWSGPQW